MSEKNLISGIFVSAVLIFVIAFFLKAIDFNNHEKTNHFELGLTMNDKIKKILQTNIDGNFIAQDIGVVHDTRTGLEWFSGPDKNTNWKTAKSWVENLDIAGGAWRMPTSDELGTLFKKGSGSNNMTPLLRTTGWYVWTGNTDKIKGSFWSRWETECFDFNFNGYESRELRWFSSLFRVIAVRTCRPKNLLEAAYQRDITTLKYLLDEGADVNTKDGEGYTALIMTAIHSEGGAEKLIKQYKITQLLIDNGADINAKQKDGYTALDYASRHDLAQVIKIIKQHSAEKRGGT